MRGVKQNIIYSGCFPFQIIYSKNPQRMNAHWHSQIEFMFFYETDGCEYQCRDKKIMVQKNDLIIANSAEIHECLDFGYSVVCCIIADLKMLGEFSGITFENLVRNDSEITAAFSKIIASADKKTFNMICASCIYDIFSELTEKYSVGDISEKQSAKRSEIHKTIQEVLSYIENNLSDNLEVKTLSAKAHLSTGRFCHVFKTCTGVSPAEYVEKARLSYAVKLLSETTSGICEIAFQCGFSDHSYFSHRFKKYMGISPGDYRKNHIVQDSKSYTDL